MLSYKAKLNEKIDYTPDRLTDLGIDRVNKWVSERTNMFIEELRSLPYIINIYFCTKLNPNSIGVK